MKAAGKGIGKILDKDTSNTHLNNFNSSDFGTSVHLSAARKKSEQAEA